MRAAARRLAPLRSAVVVAALLSGSLALNGIFGGPASARPPSTPAPMPAEAFRPMPTPSPEPSGEPAGSPSVSQPTETATPTPEPVATPAAPEIIRFRPRDGWTDVSPDAQVSVRFTIPMDEETTQRAFRASVDGVALEGRYRWAEGDTVLILVPEEAMPYAATVELTVDRSARSAEGVGLIDGSAVTFVVQSRPAPLPTPSPKPTPAPKPKTSTATAAWAWPLDGRITQRFGESLTKYGYHYGLDIAGDVGDPVRAARAGQVILAGRADECGGLQVRLDHGNGLTSWYRHLSRVQTSVGEDVAAGTVIGRVGSTGCSTGPHLHFGIRRGETFLDPLRYLPER